MMSIELRRAAMAVAIRSLGTLSEQQLRDAEDRLGFALPAGYRRWLAATNGGDLELGATLPDRDFIWEDRALGLRPDSDFDLVSCCTYFQDRFTPDYLPVADVSDGMLALKVKGERRGSVWFWSDDDPRASDEDTPADTERLLYFCGESWDEVLERLQVPEPITDEELEEFVRRHDVRLEIGPAGDMEPEAEQEPRNGGRSGSSA
jgi:hypothetical protein